MNQILLNLGNGEISVKEIPTPKVRAGHLLIRSTRSLVSLGTERMLVEFGQGSLIEKAKQQPEKVKQVLAKIKTDGFFATLNAVRSKLNQPLALGYCNAGVVEEIGDGVTGFQIGDRVVCNGSHAEVVCIPMNLCAKIPDGVSDDEAAFTVLGAIALQGIRLAQPTIGETFAVFGLGLIGLMAVQILKANGCRVIGLDLDASKCELIRSWGFDAIHISEADPTASLLSRYPDGIDGVLLTTATSSSAPVEQAAQISRKRGRIILIGTSGLELKRSLFYDKELSFQVSCSYGPGRYENDYEVKHQDYPRGFVRWTAQRNFEAVLDLLASRNLRIESLISMRSSLENAEEAYQKATEGGSLLGILIDYPKAIDRPELWKRTISLKRPSHSPSRSVVGIIGAGNYAASSLLPVLKNQGLRLKSIASSSGVTARDLGEKFKIENCTSDTRSILEDSEINTVFILTRHNTHAALAIEALKRGKRVYLEKPLAINREQLSDIIAAYGAAKNPFLMLGFNRRFAPLIQKVKHALSASQEERSIIITVNAGALPKNHWNLDLESGGGRLISEGCHFIDLARFLADSPLASLQRLDGKTHPHSASVGLRFKNASTAVIHYLDNGASTFPKERIEIFSAGKILQIDNFLALKTFGWKGLSSSKAWKLDKGHSNAVKAFIEKGEAGLESPIAFEESLEVTEASFTAAGL